MGFYEPNLPYAPLVVEGPSYWGVGRKRPSVVDPEIILVRGCENVAGKLRQKW